MRLVIARCSVDYVGRLSAHLPPATRLLMVKADGSVSVHADDRAYKPLNWMSPPCWLEEQPGVWTVRKKIEALVNDATIEWKAGPSKATIGLYATHYSSRDRWNTGNDLLLTAEPHARRLDMTLG